MVAKIRFLIFYYKEYTKNRKSPTFLPELNNQHR